MAVREAINAEALRELRGDLRRMANEAEAAAVCVGTIAKSYRHGEIEDMEEKLEAIIAWTMAHASALGALEVFAGRVLALGDHCVLDAPVATH